MISPPLVVTMSLMPIHLLSMFICLLRCHDSDLFFCALTAFVALLWRVYTSSATGPWGQSHMEWTDWASFLFWIIPLHLSIDGDTIWGFIVPGGLVVGVGWWFISCVSSDWAGLVAWHYPLAGCGWRDGTVAFGCICYGDL
jgi:hypothetical protein